jgi:hypothetical protein
MRSYAGSLDLSSGLLVAAASELCSKRSNTAAIHDALAVAPTWWELLSAPLACAGALPGISAAALHA